MATREARWAMWARKAIGATLAAGAMALAAPAGIAMADPTYGPSYINDPVVNDYMSKINAAIEQLNQSSLTGSSNQQQFIQQITTANSQLRDALLASIPAIAGR